MKNAPIGRRKKSNAEATIPPGPYKPLAVTKTSREEVADALATRPELRPLSCRRVAELKGVTEAAVRKAIASGRLPKPIMLDRSEGAEPQPFFLAFMVASWTPKS